MLVRALTAAALAAALLPASTSAATLNDVGGQLEYQAAPGDLIGFQVYGDATTTYFLPTNTPQLHPTTTTGCTVVTMGNGASSCPRRPRIRVRLAERDDFVGVQSPTDVVELRMGDGQDRMWTLGTRVEAYGEGGNDDLMGGPAIDLLDGGPGDDLLTPVSFADTVTGGPGTDTVRYSGTETVVVTLDDVANDGRRAAGPRVADNQNVKSDVENVTGGEGPDEIDGNAQGNRLRGGDGADQLNPAGGGDTVLGEAGDDVITVKDGTADTVNCGPGTDSVIADVADVLTACENVTLPDDDADGVRLPFDCDDTNPSVKPGATEVAGDGIDQDCSGADLPGPPAPPPPPGGGDPAPPPARVASRILSRYALGARVAKILQLDVRDIPAGGAVEVRCAGRGCAFAKRTVRPKGGKAALAKLFERRRLKPGAVVEIRVSAPGMIGKVVRFTIRAGKQLPRSDTLCLAPGTAQPGPC